MKRKIMPSYFFVILFILASNTIYSEHIQPVNSLQIPYASIPMTIDGIDDEVDWSGIQTTEIFNPTGWTGPDDFTLTFRVSYNENYLYIFCMIRDDVENSWDWGMSNEWTFDNVNLLIDLDTTGSGNSAPYDTNTIEIYFNRGIDSVGWSGRASRSEYIYYWENTVDGWLFEAAIPWKFALWTGQQPEDILQYFEEGVISGFELMGSDSDINGADHRDVQSAWDQDDPQTTDDRTEDNAWNNRTVFGTISFEQGGAPPPPPPTVTSGHVAPIRTMVIPYAFKQQQMVIDGIPDESNWSFWQSTDAFNPAGSTGADADFTFTFKVCYDENYLYMFSYILDDYNNSWDWGGTNPWTYDAVDVFLDLDTNGSGLNGAYDLNTINLRFARGIDSVQEPGRAKRSDFLYYWENTADGWIFETAIPWKSVLSPTQQPQDIMQYFTFGVNSGLEVHGYDSDTDGPDHRDCQTAWDNDEPQTLYDRTEGNAVSDRRVFGIVGFEQVGPTPPPPPPPSPPTASLYVKPVRTMQVPYASNTIIIDGVDDETSWSYFQSTDVFNPTGCTGADADFTLKFKVCYDENYFYLYANILDDYNNSWEWGGTNQWTFDCVELFMDLDTNGSGNTSTYDSNTYQIRFNRGLDSVGNDYGRIGQVKRSDHQYYWENTADGWLFEVALDWRFVLGTGQKPEDIMQYFEEGMRSGFDISGADSDTDGPDNRDCQTAWDNDEPQDAADRTEDNAWNNRSVFGIIEFLPPGILPPPPPVTLVDEVLVTDNNYIVTPNPASSALKISNLKEDSNIEILNLLGQCLVEKEVCFTSEIIDIEGLKPGIYLIRIAGLNQVSAILKFIKN